MHTLHIYIYTHMYIYIYIYTYIYIYIIHTYRHARLAPGDDSCMWFGRVPQGNGRGAMGSRSPPAC